MAVALALVALLAAPGPQIHGRVFEDGAAGGPPRPIAEVEITVQQQGLLQRRRTSATGEFRFRAIDGAATLEITSVPVDYTVEGSSRVLLQVRAATVAEANFRLRGHRRVTGRVLLDHSGGGVWAAEDLVFEGVRVLVGGREGESDAEGIYSVLDVPAGLQRVALAARSGLPAGFTALDRPAVQMPQATGHATVDILVRAPLQLPRLTGPLPPARPLQAGAERMRVLPLPPVSRPIAEWASNAVPAEQLINGLEKLAATVMLDDEMRLLLVARADPQPSAREAFRRALRGISSLQRYLEGPGLVPRSRLLAAVTQAGPEADLGARDVLDLLLVRIEHDE